MTIERSDKIHESWRLATEKFDYFVLGVTGALCAYISQKYVPEKFGFNPGTFELLALVILVVAAVYGFRRIEKTMQLTLLNHQRLRTKEERGSLISEGPGPLLNKATGDVFSPEKIQAMIQQKTAEIPLIEKQIEELGSQALFAYKARNYLILIGFCTLVFAKLYSAYV
jgi:hypothetical protein